MAGAPNPFTQSTRLVYAAPRATGAPAPGAVRIDIFDAGGRLMRSLADEPGSAEAAGSMVWDGRDGSGSPVPAGVYFARLTAGKASACRSLIRIE